MKNRHGCPIDILENLIFEERERLKDYRSSEKSKERYVNRLKNLISTLELVVILLKNIKYLKLWEKLDREIQESEAKDPNLTGHSIHIRTKPGKRRNSFFDIDLRYRERRRI